MIQKGYHKHYCMLWAIDANDREPHQYPSIPFFNTSEPIRSHILNETQLIIDSNRYIPKIGSTSRIHVRHGCSFKKCIGYYNQIGNVDAIITTSDDMRAIDEKVWPKQCNGKFIVTGLPSNDRLFSPANISQFLNELTGETKIFNKIIGWLPTYRQHRWGNKTINHKYPFGLPLIKTQSDLINTNNYLHTHNILLLIQMHHAQAKNYASVGNYSNIKVVTEPLKNKYRLTNGDILGHCDALITDYSAAYHEYIILNRPIALTIDDICEYEQCVGFCYPYKEWIHGQYCTTLENLTGFFNNVIDNPVALVKQQLDSLNRIHKYVDANSTKRVVEYLEDNKFITK